LNDGSPVCIQTDFKDIPLFRRGKVRDIYEAGDNLVLIASDRISAFDVVLPTPIPMKGAVLTQLSQFWFGMIGDIVSNHLISTDVDAFPGEFQPHREVLRLRSMLVKRAQIFPVECVARGYLVGSGWKEYRETGAVCGITLPSGLRECDRLPEPIFTPATKAEEGHDMNIPFNQMERIVGAEYAAKLRDLTFRIYQRAADFALEKGIIIADTKFEFGLFEGEILVCDEVLTPDSSRFWPQDEYEPGRAQVSFDKQYVRDYLEEVRFDKKPPGPELPERVVEATTGKYLEAYKLLTGRELDG
jgi:phosphoribosylaminoimidazole-succinocarboxamide synthase